MNANKACFEKVKNIIIEEAFIVVGNYEFTAAAACTALRILTFFASRPVETYRNFCQLLITNFYDDEKFLTLAKYQLF